MANIGGPVPSRSTSAINSSDQNMHDCSEIITLPIGTRRKYRYLIEKSDLTTL